MHAALLRFVFSSLYQICQIYFVECVSKIKHILSVIHYTICGAVYFQFVVIERIHILCLIIIIKSEVWTITHCLGLGHETMVSAVCLSIFLSSDISKKVKWEKFSNTGDHVSLVSNVLEMGTRPMSFVRPHNRGVSVQGQWCSRVCV